MPDTIIQMICIDYSCITVTIHTSVPSQNDSVLHRPKSKHSVFDPAEEGDPVLYQHLLWSFGHPVKFVPLFNLDLE